MKKPLRYCSHCGFAIKKECQCCPNCGIILLEGETKTIEEVSNDNITRSKRFKPVNKSLEVGFIITMLGLNLIGLIITSVGLAEVIKRRHKKDIIFGIITIILALIKLVVEIGFIVYFVKEVIL